MFEENLTEVQRMSQSSLFSSGLELASLIVNSNVLYHSWDAISKLRGKSNEAASLLPVIYEFSEQSNYTILAFDIRPPSIKDHLQGEGGDYVLSSAHQETFPLFQFLCTKINPHVSINRRALDLFASAREDLPTLKSRISNSKPLIITGHSMGGSVSSLFTLWLLNKIDFATAKRPLCVTFGSPLTGDNGLQQAITPYSAWNSCFLHVVSDQDPVPGILMSPHNPPARESDSQTTEYSPFGTYLMCSELGCACLENPESILELLRATDSEGPRNRDPNQVLEFFDYKHIVNQLNGKVIRKDGTRVDGCIAQPLQAGIILQLVAIGLGRAQQPRQQGIDINSLITKTEKQERIWLMRSSEVFDDTELSKMKVDMANLEWYKKVSKHRQTGYYDSYKNAREQSDRDVEMFMKRLTCYWEKMVDDVEKEPQKEGASLRTRWLYGGTNYRRMVEPLHIAEYYRNGHTDYINKGRSKHFEQLEEWLNKEKKPASGPDNSKKQNVEANLTEDSCFWAHVEEARISCKKLSGREPSDMNIHREKLKKFEDDVWGMLKNYAVSPEIFLKGSSFMKWWEEYKKIIKETPYSSPLTDLLKNRQYSQYATGCL